MMRPIFDERGQPIRCQCCHGMFGYAPTAYGDRGPLCDDCIMILDGPPLRGLHSARELFGERTFEILTSRQQSEKLPNE